MVTENSLKKIQNLVLNYKSQTVISNSDYSCILMVTGQVYESQKGTSINTNHSYHQCSSSLTSLKTALTIKSDAVLTNPTGKDGMQGWLS